MTINPKKVVILKDIKQQAQEWKREALRKKYAPPPPPEPEAVEEEDESELEG